MFTIQARIEKKYQLSAEKNRLYEFFSDINSYPRYMPDIFHKVEPIKGTVSLWTLKIDVSAGSPLVVKVELDKKGDEASLIAYEPLTNSQNHLALKIKLGESSLGLSKTDLIFILEIKLERNRSSEVHPLAGLLGEKAINKIVQKHAEGYIDDFVKSGEEKAARKR
ncbi:MAG: hypothetical protein JNN15_06740 [Blastocatellia bacterium]|nr:hypothetical protein [Blastocatellia bacterium]